MRVKQIALNVEHWDLFALPEALFPQIQLYFDTTVGSAYDLWGALGCVSGLQHHQQKYFCSEWCFNAIFQSEQGWRFSPSQLAEVVKHKNSLKSIIEMNL